MQMLELADKNIKTVVRTVFYMFKWWSRDMEENFKSPNSNFWRWKLQCLRWNNTLDGISSRLDMAEEKISEPKDIAAKNIQNEAQKKKKNQINDKSISELWNNFT